MDAVAPKTWGGRVFEDFAVGDVYWSRAGRTVTETDNVWITCMTQAYNQVHFNALLAERTRFGETIVYSALTLAIVGGLSVPDTSENAAANLGFEEVRLPRPVYAGDTLWAESEILETRPSASRPNVGIVRMRTRGINQRKEVAIEFLKAFMVYRRGALELSGLVLEPAEPWGSDA
ncbi:MAG: MaoC family dehydratase [Actinomycetia bacterium]|nr:MaoC family dehydratase [Actinomycetes bacterium]